METEHAADDSLPNDDRVPMDEASDEAPQDGTFAGPMETSDTFDFPQPVGPPSSLAPPPVPPPPSPPEPAARRRRADSVPVPPEARPKVEVPVDRNPYILPGGCNVRCPKCPRNSGRSFVGAQGLLTHLTRQHPGAAMGKDLVDLLRIYGKGQCSSPSAASCDRWASPSATGAIRMCSSSRWCQSHAYRSELESLSQPVTPNHRRR